MEKKVKDLERLLGKKTLEKEILQDALRTSQGKTSYRGNLFTRREALNESNIFSLKYIEIKPRS